MSGAFLIIDGYNLMHAAGLARANYGPGDLARQRHELLLKLTRRLTAEERKRCTVVFDAVDAPTHLSRRFKHEEMGVFFADPGHEADELIELLIAQHSSPRQLTVVSSDHRLQKAIHRRRGSAVDSEVFLKQIESPHRQVGPTRIPSQSATDPDRELKFWLEEFDAVRPESLNAEIQAQSSEPRDDWTSRIEDLQKRVQDKSGLEDWLNESDKRISPREPSGK